MFYNSMELYGNFTSLATNDNPINRLKRIFRKSEIGCQFVVRRRFTFTITVNIRDQLTILPGFWGSLLGSFFYSYTLFSLSVFPFLNVLPIFPVSPLFGLYYAIHFFLVPEQGFVL